MNPAGTAGAPAASTAEPRHLVYDGRLGDLYHIFFVNLLRGIVPLGIYRFWGRARYRRYLWSHTAYAGDRFEYTGTGGELFRGFLIAMAIFVPLITGIAILQTALLPARPGLFFAIAAPVYLLLIVLLFASRYTALRYRLTRPRWRGIRGGLAGSAFNYALRSIGYGVLSGLTLYQFVPFATIRLWRYRLNNVFFGTERASFDGHGRHLYPRYLAALAVWILLGIAIGGVVLVGIQHSVAQMQAMSSPAAATPTEPATAQTTPPDRGPAMGAMSIWHSPIVLAGLVWW